MPTREQWHAMIEERLPAPTDVIARNRAITAYYARWYLQEPWLFQWAGMAAFASHQVGVALALAAMLDSPHGVVAEEAGPQQSLLDFGLDLYGRAVGLAMFIPLALHDAATRPLLLNDLAVLQQGNEAIFQDIGWAHLAYATGGIRAVEANLREGERQHLLPGFQLIDEGAHLLSRGGDEREGLALIRRGSVAMLRHEQMDVLPRFFEAMSDLGKVIASIGAWLDFEGSGNPAGQPWFGGHFGTVAIASGRRSVANAADRWEWIEGDVLPKWARANASYSEHSAMHRRLTAIAEEAPTTLQQAAGLMSSAYMALGLRVGPRAPGGRGRQQLAAHPGEGRAVSAGAVTAAG